MGTPEFAVPTLARLVEGGYNVVAVVTQPDKPVGRHQTSTQPSAVKTYAVEHGLPVLQPEKMKDPAFVEQLAAYKADIQVVVAFRMLPEVVWAMPRFGTFNVHAALLPQYRGAAPINWAIINGETETGVTTFFLDKDIDTGRIIMQRRLPIPDDANVEYVYDHLMALGAEIAVETLDKVIETDGNVEAVDQKTLTTEPLHAAPKIFKETCEIDWNQPAKRVYDFIRGLAPYPAAWTTLQRGTSRDARPERPKSHGAAANNTLLKIYTARKTGLATNGAPVGSLRTDRHQLFVACADQWLELLDLQLAGKKRMSARDFLNGNHDLDTATVG